MANRYVAIWLSVGCLVMLVGCVGPAAEPDTARPAIVMPPAASDDLNAAEAPATAQREPEAGEPNDIAEPAQKSVDVAVATEADGPDAGDVPTEELAPQEYY